MRNLNEINGAAGLLLDVARIVLDRFPDPIGVEMGIAYGGGVEAIGKIWNNSGTIYGFDTFEGHPKEIANEDKDCINGVNSFAAICMDNWYAAFDNTELEIEYQQAKLMEQGITNVVLVKGLITEQTNVSFIPYINYCLLDLDFVLSMKNAYNLVKDKIVSGGYLCLHDVIPFGHIDGLNEWYNEIKTSYEVVEEYPNSYLAILKKL